MLACHLPTRKITKFSEHELASSPRATPFTWEAKSEAVRYCLSLSFFFFFCEYNFQFLNDTF